MVALTKRSNACFRCRVYMSFLLWTRVGEALKMEDGEVAW